MKLIDALQKSNCNQVVWRDKVWGLCRNYDGIIDFVSNAGHWSESWLSNHYDHDMDDFEPYILSDEEIEKRSKE